MTRLTLVFAVEEQGAISNRCTKFKQLFKSATGQNQGVFVNFWPLWQLGHNHLKRKSLANLGQQFKARSLRTSLPDVEPQRTRSERVSSRSASKSRRQSNRPRPLFRSTVCPIRDCRQLPLPLYVWYVRRRPRDVLVKPTRRSLGGFRSARVPGDATKLRVGRQVSCPAL